MSKDMEYYRIFRGGDDNIPLLDQVDGYDYLDAEKPIEEPKLMLFELGDPVPRKPKMADYHSSPECIVSKRIFDVLQPLNIYGIQLLPARIKGKNDEEFDDYWGIHIYNSLECIDVNLSECRIDRIRIAKVKKLVLDKEKLAKVPLEKRLIFRMKEDSSYKLFHASVANAIMAINPEGLKFVNIEDWTNASYYAK